MAFVVLEILDVNRDKNFILGNSKTEKSLKKFPYGWLNLRRKYREGPQGEKYFTSHFDRMFCSDDPFRK